MSSARDRLPCCLIAAAAMLPCGQGRAGGEPLPLTMRGSRIVSLAGCESGADATSRLAEAGISVVDDASFAQVCVQTMGRDQSGHHGLRMVWKPETGHSSNIPVVFSVQPPAKVFALVPANGRKIAALSLAELTQARLLGFGSNGSILAEAESAVAPIPSHSMSLGTAQDAISRVWLSYGNTNQEEEVVVFGVFRDSDPTLPASQTSATGERRKISAAWLEPRREHELLHIRARARLRHTDAVGGRSEEQRHVLVARAEISDLVTGRMMRALAVEHAVPRAAAPGSFVDGSDRQGVRRDPGRDDAIIEIDVPWDGEDDQGQRVVALHVGVKLLIEARHLPPCDVQGQCPRTVDQVVLTRGLGIDATPGVRRLDGSVIAQQLLANPPVDREDSEVDALSDLLQSNPEAGGVFLECALSTDKPMNERLRCVYYTSLMRDPTLTSMLSPLMDDPSPVLALATAKLLASSAFEP